MSHEIAVYEVEARGEIQTKPQDLLAKVVEAVRGDCQQSPAAFLGETTVPHGGE